MKRLIEKFLRLKAFALTFEMPKF